MKTDSKIQEDVLQELKWDPRVTHEYIGVSVSSGIVTLSGSVPSYAQKISAEKAAQRVAGVKAVVEKIEVKLPNSFKRGDDDIAKSIVHQFDWDVMIPNDLIKTNVEKGWVELSGEVPWEFQKAEAEKIVRKTTGVVGVRNFIKIKAKTIQPDTIKQKITEALKRSAEKDAKNINVEVRGTEVTLTGEVSSYSEKEDARWAAFSAPGITRVQNDIEVTNY